MAEGSCQQCRLGHRLPVGFPNANRSMGPEEERSKTQMSIRCNIAGAKISSGMCIEGGAVPARDNPPPP